MTYRPDGALAVSGQCDFFVRKIWIYAGISGAFLFEDLGCGRFS